LTPFVNVANTAGVPLLLPTGQVLMVGSSCRSAAPRAAGRFPESQRIVKYPATVAPGRTFTMFGTQFDGVSRAVAFGRHSNRAEPAAIRR